MTKKSIRDINAEMEKPAIPAEHEPIPSEDAVMLDIRIASLKDAVPVSVTEIQKIQDEWEKAGIGNSFIFGKIMTFFFKDIREKAQESQSHVSFKPAIRIIKMNHTYH